MAEERRTAVAGQFYPGNPEQLRDKLMSCYHHPLGPGSLPETAGGPVQGVVGFVVPHAGYDYSGPVAAHVFHRVGRLGRPDVAVLMGPNHHGLGRALALSPWLWWGTPLGDLSVDSALGESLKARVAGLEPDVKPHQKEHSVEVQPPFLLHIYGTSLPILPIAMADHSLATARVLGEALAQALEGTSAVVLASSDLNHYRPEQEIRQEDGYALEALRAMDEEGLARVAHERNLNMCGLGPMLATMVACRSLGVTSAPLLAYWTSGDTCGDRRRVVGYAAVEMSAA